ncbi:uncharacterized protein BO66DRAFT_393186 [Aspergillus aculeatinus CBS 121060]|uniref:Uncharacterized protein n=1 Tax=Aspergillus aculeatinus CBS 121060 TaxID=1448322 RepID=A0ACD1H4R6_9EURO|nr:hypothetical protein BO66DRAFT_393186 [Aspergillus aculeatinus CBS 121060]RAH68405.1 hypothetical protein BO66DRAFT_393186 [Aspergillus aculeatinus CBS 121060]
MASRSLISHDNKNQHSRRECLNNVHACKDLLQSLRSPSKHKATRIPHNQAKSITAVSTGLFPRLRTILVYLEGAVTYKNTFAPSCGLELLLQVYGKPIVDRIFYALHQHKSNNARMIVYQLENELHDSVDTTQWQDDFAPTLMCFSYGYIPRA